MFLILLAASLAAFIHRNDVEAMKYNNVGLVGGGMGMGGMGMGGMGMGMGGMGMGMGGMGGFGMDKSIFNGGMQNMNDIFFNGKGGKQGGQFDQGQKGFHQGVGMGATAKGDQGAFKGYKGGKNLITNGMGYQGGNKFGKQGKKGDQKGLKEARKKGHGVKSYKTSHEKNENSQNEEFYDEEHDEGDKNAYAGQKGAFGDAKGSGVKGGMGEAAYNAGEQKKGGKYGEQYLKDVANGQGGQYGGKKFAGGKAGYVANNAGDLKNAGGHEAAEKMFNYHKQPIMYGR